ncbi:MAG: cysteine desulfurase [Prevotella sp.]|nr:cysteine desulfurase [Prevotella sp.]
MLDIRQIRDDFPILNREVYGKQLIYLDNAATTQKPRQVVEAMTEEYYNVNANVHRGVHFLSQRATDLHEGARETVRAFLNAEKVEEIVFTRGTTESINLVAQTFCESQMNVGDEVIISTVEHHSNIVPWQLQAEKHGIVLKVIPMTDDGQLLLDEYESLFSERTKIVSCAHVSNVLGTVNPIKQMIAVAHKHGVPFLIDAAQSAPHMALDVQDLDCDFLAFSGHKMYGPTGIGVLYGKAEWLDKLPPYQGGGEMIATVSFERSTFEKAPLRFEAGTPDYIATTGLARAIDYINSIGFENIEAHEQELTCYCIEQMKTIEGLTVYGSSLDSHDAVVSFNIFAPFPTGVGERPIHHMDIGTLLDRFGIAVRTGHHCAQPLMDRLGILGTVRASFAVYNTKEEIDSLVTALRRIIPMF